MSIRGSYNKVGDKQLINLGFSFSEFISIEEFTIKAMINESKRLTQDAKKITLSGDDFDRFSNTCKQGVEPNERLKNVLKP